MLYKIYACGGIHIKGIPLNELRIEIDHTGSDEANWESVWITPCYGSLKLTDPISVGGKQFEDSKWDTGFQSKLKNAAYRSDQQPDMSQTVTALNVQVRVSAEPYAGTDDDVYLCAYWGGIKDPKKEVLLDKSWYNDLEMGDCDNYLMVLNTSESEGIPLDKLRIGFRHEGDDESNWAEVLITPISGSTALTAPISVGGQKFENSTWDTDFQNCLKMQYTPIEIEYETNLDDGLLSYMGSLDGGEEWVDNANELWANTTLRREIFFKLFKGFAPEIIYVRDNIAPEDNRFDIGFDFTGVWNGVSNERRAQVKDLEHVYPVEGSADVEVINENGDVVHTLGGMSVQDGSVQFTLKTDGWESGYYDLKVSYSPYHANPLYSGTEMTFEKVIKVGGLMIKTQPQDTTVEAGQPATLTVEAVGGKAPYTYTWQFTRAGSWATIPNLREYTGQGTNALTLTADTAGSVAIRCVVRDANGEIAESDAATITRKVPDLVIKTQPKDAIAETGETTTLTVEASGGTKPYTYNWRVNADGRIWFDIQNGSGYAGQGTNTLTYTSKLAGTYTLHCVVKDANGNSVTSNTVNITVNAKEAPITITTQPKDVTVATSEQTTLTVKASGGKEPYVYTWQQYSRNKGWVDVSGGGQLLGPQYFGQGTSSLRFASNIEGTTRLRCVVRDLSGNSVTSDEATVTVERTVDPLSIKVHPQSSTVEEGETAIFTVEVSGGTTPYTYTWQMPATRGGAWTDLWDGSVYAGQGTDTLSFTSDSAGTTKVRCVVKDAFVIVRILFVYAPNRIKKQLRNFPICVTIVVKQALRKKDRKRRVYSHHARGD